MTYENDPRSGDQSTIPLILSVTIVSQMSNYPLCLLFLTVHSFMLTLIQEFFFSCFSKNFHWIGVYSFILKGLFHFKYTLDFLFLIVPLLSTHFLLKFVSTNEHVSRTPCFLVYTDLIFLISIWMSSTV